METALPRASSDPLEGLAEEQAWAYAARYDLAAYAEFVHGYVPARHHVMWLDELHRIVESDELEKVLFVAPPGHAKSTYLSEVFPTWYLGRNPGKTVLHFTATDPLALLAHKQVEAVLGPHEAEKAQAHRLVFPDGACRAGDPWNFESGLKLAGSKQKVSYKMAGYGSAVIGLRADVTILDDPLKQEQAESEVEVAKAKSYFDRTLFSRRQPGAKFIAIMTRWTWNDLAEHLLRKWGFRLIHLPALGHWQEDGSRVADLEGGALWPGYWSREALLENLHGDGTPENQGMSLDAFTTIYQGLPTRAEGNILSPDLVQQMPDLEAERGDGTPVVRMVDRVQFWDLAFRLKTRSDWTVCATLGTDGSSLYLLDLYRARLTEQQFEQQLEVRYAAHRPRVVGIENVAQHGAYAWVVEGISNRKLLPIRGVPTNNQSKEARAELFSLKLQQKRFFADRRAPWWPALAQEMQQFPHGTHDDMVDAIAGACHLLGNQASLVATRKYAHVNEPGRRRRSLRGRLPATVVVSGPR